MIEILIMELNLFLQNSTSGEILKILNDEIIQQNQDSGDTLFWSVRSCHLMTALIESLVVLREQNLLILTQEEILKYSELNDIANLSDNPFLPEENKNNLTLFLQNIPGYFSCDDFSEQSAIQYNYIFNLISKIFKSS